AVQVARLRARGQLGELRADDLRFTPGETAAFLREATGLDLPSASVAALQDLTEGWAAGVQLAALSLRGRPDPVGFVATFSGSHRFVLDYLGEEVLARLPSEVVGGGGGPPAQRGGGLPAGDLGAGPAVRAVV